MTNGTTPLHLIDHNPWQTRAIDQAHAQALAEDIAANTLLQPPVARLHPTEKGRVQLALGHHRFAAFQILAKTDKAYSVMPVEIRELTDLEMADIAISENQKRKDLSPIEKAQALRRLIDEFKLSQEAAGKRFGLTQSGASNLLRLLKLPAGIQTLTDGQRLPERHARQLVTLSKSLPNQAEAVARKVAEAAPEEKDDTFDSAMRNVLTTHGRQMWNPPFKTDEQLPIEHVAKVAGKMGLTALPLCKGCEFFLERDGMNYCARPGCFDAKKESAMWKASASSAKALGIAVAAPGEKVTLVFDGDDNQVALAKAALKAKHESLRVVVSSHAANDTWRPEARQRKELLGSHWLALASTDVTALKKSLPVEAVKESAKPKLSSAEQRAEDDRKWKAKQAVRDAEIKEQRRMEASAARVIAPLLPSHAGVLELIQRGAMNGQSKPKDSTLGEKKLTAATVLIQDYLDEGARDDIEENIDDAEQPTWNTPEWTRVGLVLLAGKLKVKLPADFAPNGHAPNGKSNGKRESGVSTGKLSKRAKAQAAKPQPKKKGKRK